ncbi:MAG: 50S ribosomal protein L18 [Planctomycetota bacterium]|nr:MAG: 50S ribosomal protein L18 [Planctomycetota bacterium]
MDKFKHKALRRQRRRIGTRKRVTGTPERPRLAVYRSLNHIYAQVIDDLAGVTLASASTRDKGVSLSTGTGTGNALAAEAVGAAIAERAKKAGVSKVVFDRGGFKYHGRVKALADAARKAGLEF